MRLGGLGRTLAELVEHVLGGGAEAMPIRRATFLRVDELLPLEQGRHPVPATDLFVVVDDLVVAGDRLQRDVHELLGAAVDMPVRRILRQVGFIDEGEDPDASAKRATVTASHEAVVASIFFGDDREDAVGFDLKQLEHCSLSLWVNTRY